MKPQTLVERYSKEIKGVIECFDRVVLFGTYKAIGWTGAMAQHLRGRGTTFMEFNKVYANELRLEVDDHVRTLARAEGIEIRQVNAGERKEALVEEILAVRGRREGVVSILGPSNAAGASRSARIKRPAFSSFSGVRANASTTTSTALMQSLVCAICAFRRGLRSASSFAATATTGWSGR